MRLPNPAIYTKDTVTIHLHNPHTEKLIEFVFVKMQVNGFWYWIPMADTFMSIVHFHGYNNATFT